MRAGRTGNLRQFAAVLAGLLMLTALAAARPAVARSVVRLAAAGHGQAPDSVLRNLGWSVAVSGTTVVAGALSANQNRGLAQVFVRAGTSWHHQATLPDPAGISQDDFGTSVAVTSTSAGALALIGAPASGTSRPGTAYIYRSSGGVWHRKVTLADPGGRGNDQFGSSVALSRTASGTFAVVGALGTNNGHGAAYIYGLAAGSWRRLAALHDPGSHAGAFGVSVAISGTTVVVGAPGQSGAGHSYVYARSGATWRLQATMRAPGGQGADQFGSGVAVSGTTVVVGAPGVDGAVQRAYVYVRSGGSWRRQAALAAPPVKFNTAFGSSVAASGQRILVGADNDKQGTRNCGSAYEFAVQRGSWAERAKILNPQCATTSEFGFSVALSGRTAVIGAPGPTGIAYVLVLP